MATPAEPVSIAAEYSPSDQVLRCHNIPRLDASLSSSSFDSWPVDNKSFDSYDGDIGTILRTNILYFQSLYTLPLIIFCFTVVAVLGWMVTRYCVQRCGPKEKDYIDNPNKVVSRRKANVATFLCTVVLSIIASNYLWKSDADIKAATSLIVTAGKDVRSLCSGALDNFADITANKQNIETILSATTCVMNAAAADSQNSVLAGMQAVQAGLDVSHGYLTTIPEAMSSFEDMFNIIYQHDYVYLVYAFFFITTMCFVVGYYYRSKLVMVGTTFLTCFIVIGCTALSCAVMVWAQGLADFCMRPTHNLVNMAPPGDTRTFLEFVATCTSPDPTAASTQYFQTGFATAEMPLRDLQTQCSSQVPAEASKWQSAVDSLDDISASSSSIAEATSCESLNLTYDLIINDTTCTTGFYGIYQLFLNCFTLSSVFFSLVLLVGYQWEFYKFGWHMQYGDLGIDVNNPADEDLDGDIAAQRMSEFRQGRGRNHKLNAAANNNPILSNADQPAPRIGNAINDSIPGSVPVTAKAAYAANSSRWGFGRGSSTSAKASGASKVDESHDEEESGVYEPPL